MEMIERVARAILRGEKGRDAQDAYWTTECTGSHVYYAMAQAAIAAMREPSDDMLVASEEAAPELACFLPREQSPSLHAWQAMIDAALTSNGDS